ncbi:hypothetical protein, partial [Streptomyces anthocyanicus]|uniref:hypothetical protein n=1 Tax=Streptomyces anthocyanicus TaxID=68174 RepID=UPI00365A0381
PELLGVPILTPHLSARRDLVDEPPVSQAEQDAASIVDLLRKLLRYDAGAGRSQVLMPADWAQVNTADIVRLRDTEQWQTYLDASVKLAGAADASWLTQGDENGEAAETMVEFKEAENDLFRALDDIRSGAGTKRTAVTRGVIARVDQGTLSLEVRATPEGYVLLRTDGSPAGRTGARTSVPTSFRILVADVSAHGSGMDDSRTLQQVLLRQGSAAMEEIIDGIRREPGVTDGGTIPAQRIAADVQTVQ